MAKAKTKPAKRRPSSKKKARRVVTKGAVKAELKHIPWNSIQLEDLNPLLKRQFRSEPAKRRPSSKKKARRVVTKGAVKAELKHIPWNSIQLEDLNPLLKRQF